MATLAPNQTLYASNLNEKIKKEDLKRYLYGLFNQYGRVVDIVALKTMSARGQAFILFTDVESSTIAMNALQGCLFFGKPLRIQYARTTSKLFQNKRKASIDDMNVSKKPLVIND
jgi:U2 small nuclear ribonucleoprotein B''